MGEGFGESCNVPCPALPSLVHNSGWKQACRFRQAASLPLLGLQPGFLTDLRLADLAWVGPEVGACNALPKF
jgi:hypothetical protein